MEQNGGEAHDPESPLPPWRPPQTGEKLAAELYERYAGRLRAVARRRLGKLLLRKIDPEDVLQSVFCCFFERVGRNQYIWPNEPSLWRLLVRLTQSKCGHKRRYYHAARRDVRREQAAPESAAIAGRVGPESWETAAEVPTPAELSALADTVAEVKRRLSTPSKRRIFELSLLGHTIVEISSETGYYERGVERVRAEIKNLLLTLLAEDEKTPVARCA